MFAGGKPVAYRAAAPRYQQAPKLSTSTSPGSNRCYVHASVTQVFHVQRLSACRSPALNNPCYRHAVLQVGSTPPLVPCHRLQPHRVDSRWVCVCVCVALTSICLPKSGLPICLPKSGLPTCLPNLPTQFAYPSLDYHGDAAAAGFLMHARTNCCVSASGGPGLPGPLHW
jgi:hypothetical protein